MLDRNKTLFTSWHFQRLSGFKFLDGPLGPSRNVGGPWHLPEAPHPCGTDLVDPDTPLEKARMHYHPAPLLSVSSVRAKSCEVLGIKCAVVLRTLSSNIEMLDKNKTLFTSWHFPTSGSTQIQSAFFYMSSDCMPDCRTHALLLPGLSSNAL